MIETTESIIQWANDAFGAAPKQERAIARANEEMAELLRALTSGVEPAKCAEECADVAIVLVGRSFLFGCSLSELLVTNVSERPWAPPLYYASKAQVALGQFMECVSLSPHNDSRPYYVATVLTDLEKCCIALGFNLLSCIDAKMAINRNRVWNQTGDGHGYHVRDKANAADGAA